MRPTGKLHIGHYIGAVQSWVRLQNDPEYDCFYFIADWHALTSDYADTSAVAQNTIEIVTDYLAAGLDPRKCIIFQQSLIPEHAELHLLLSMVTPLSWLERVPTYKEAFENVKDKDLHTYGFLGYPCLQTADIVIYSKEGTPLVVPVGEDQVSHVELSREIVRKFNLHYGFKFRPELFDPANLESLVRILYPEAPMRRKNPLQMEEIDKARHDLHRRVMEEGKQNFMDFVEERDRRLVDFTEVLAEPEVMLTHTPRIPGLDGRKMSKSYGNAIMLSESDDDIRKKTK